MPSGDTHGAHPSEDALPTGGRHPGLWPQSHRGSIVVDTEPRDAVEGESGQSPVVSARWDESDSASLAVVSAVASASGTDPTALPPLQETVDADALDTLAANRSGSGGSTRVSFAYAGWAVLVDSGGIVEVWPRHSS